MSKLIRISNAASEKLESLSKLTGQSRQKILDQAVIFFTQEQILKKANEQYRALKNNPEEWKAFQTEHEEWDITLGDGLKND